jgi:PleD family two-component response regulator
LERTGGPIKDGGKLPPVSISVGVATLRESLPRALDGHRRDPSGSLLASADRALYRAKAGGRSRTHAARTK